MKLWLDDVRVAPIGWTWAKTANDAIAYLTTGAVEVASLDHDLSEEHYPGSDDYSKNKTGYDVVKWMEENSVWPKGGCTVHSMNPVGRVKMQAVIDAAYAQCCKICGRMDTHAHYGVGE